MSEATTRPKPAMKLTTLHVHAAGLVGVLSLAGLAYALAYVPTSQAMAQAESQRQVIIKTNEEAVTLASQLRDARQELSLLQAAARDLEAHTASLTDIVTDSLSEHALAAHNVSESEPTPEGNLQRTVLEVHATGGFSDIVAWLEDVHVTMRWIAVESLSIMPQPADESALVLQASLSAYSPQPAPSSTGGKDPATEPQDVQPPAR